MAARALSPGSGSGVATATRELATALAGRGHAVHLITRSPDAAVDGAHVHAIAALTPASPEEEPLLDHLSHAAAVHRAVAEIHAREGVDVVVAPLWGCEGVVCLLDPRFPTVVSCMTSMATIAELRGSVPDEAAEELIALERATVARAPYVHGLTRAALDKTLADYDADLVASEVIGRGLADRAGPRSDGDDAAPAAAGPPTILFVGRLERRKGVATLLDAARRLAGDGVTFSLVLAGPDSPDTESGEPYRTAFERDADPALAARVRFAGVVSDAERDELYRTADVVCVPSRYESHGVVAIEAMMFGRPIVASATGGVPEVVEEEGNALLVQPGDAGGLADALARLLGDADLRRRLGARSRELYEERFEVGETAAAMEVFLRRIAAAHGAGDVPPADVEERFAAVIRELRPLGREAALGLAHLLLAPPVEAWHAEVLAVERDRAALHGRAAEAERQVGEWRARALEAERQREAVEDELERVTGSRSWQLTLRARRAAETLRDRFGRDD